MSELNITADNFEAEVTKSSIPVLVDFWAEWCGPCRRIGPIVSELAQTYEGKLKVGKVNVDEEPDLANNFDVISIPTILVFNNGELVQKKIGAASKYDIEPLFKDLI
jgi:thioredoxin 1